MMYKCQYQCTAFSFHQDPMVNIGYWKLENELFKVTEYSQLVAKNVLCVHLCVQEGENLYRVFDTHIRLMLDFIFNIFCIDTDAAGELFPFAEL